MKEFHGTAGTTVLAPLERSFATVYAVEDYPSWNRDLFRAVDVLERDADGGASKARATLRVARGRFVKEFELLVAVRAERPKAVYIERIPHEPSDEEGLQLIWGLKGDQERTHIELRFAAAISSLPSFLPLGGAGDQIARSLVQGVTRALA
ncbi:MAG: hypothetical protein JO372_22405 [Solirubrobacterales bacterium]|nr:hypothetical protein [Solirubrobacterales bacterium]